MRNLELWTINVLCLSSIISLALCFFPCILSSIILLKEKGMLKFSHLLGDHIKNCLMGSLCFYFLLLSLFLVALKSNVFFRRIVIHHTQRLMLSLSVKLYCMCVGTTERYNNNNNNNNNNNDDDDNDKILNQ